MNIFRIFLDSSITAQIIMTILSIFSIWSWAIFLKKLLDLSRLNTLCKRFFSSYRFQHTIKEMENMGSLLNDNPFGRILNSGLDEYKRLRISIKGIIDPAAQARLSLSMDELTDNIRLIMEKGKLFEIANLETSLPTLSTFVSVSPFLGLLGTVWGVMVAFLDIRTRGSAHITVVAPGISDALITTVYGLLVAIPALIFYNIFRSRVNHYDNELTQFIKEAYTRLRKNMLLDREN
jgi:biopolymer transport protein TolQ